MGLQATVLWSSWLICQALTVLPIDASSSAGMGAGIGRSVVNFDGPIVFVVVGRYHGGAYVVFSKALNPKLRAFAIEGSFASVIGGAPAAAVVFPRDVLRRANADPRVIELETEIEGAPAAQKSSLRERLVVLREEVMLKNEVRWPRSLIPSTLSSVRWMWAL